MLVLLLKAEGDIGRKKTAAGNQARGSGRCAPLGAELGLVLLLLPGLQQLHVAPRVAATHESLGALVGLVPPRQGGAVRDEATAPAAGHLGDRRAAPPEDQAHVPLLELEQHRERVRMPQLLCPARGNNSNDNHEKSAGGKRGKGSGQGNSNEEAREAEEKEVIEERERKKKTG